jgi:hypothetical protein
MTDHDNSELQRRLDRAEGEIAMARNGVFMQRLENEILQTKLDEATAEIACLNEQIARLKERAK